MARRANDLYPKTLVYAVDDLELVSAPRALLQAAPGSHLHTRTMDDDLPSADADPHPPISPSSSTTVPSDETTIADAAVEAYWQHLMTTEDFPLARTIATNIREVRSVVLGAEHRATIEAATLVGDALLKLDDPTALRRLAGRMLELTRRRLSADHTTALNWQRVLAYALRCGSELASSVALSEDLLARCRRLLGDEHEASRSIAVALVSAMVEHGDYDAARVLAQDLRSWQIRASGRP